jgi:flagellar protein FlaG
LQFTVDEITNRVVLTVSDKESGEIIRQIPSSQVLKAAHNIEQLKGILFDDIF